MPRILLMIFITEFAIAATLYAVWRNWSLALYFLGATIINLALLLGSGQ